MQTISIRFTISDGGDYLLVRLISFCLLGVESADDVPHFAHQATNEIPQSWCITII